MCYIYRKCRDVYNIYTQNILHILVYLPVYIHLIYNYPYFGE